MNAKFTDDNGEEIAVSNIDELITYIKKLNLTEYDGYDEYSYIKAQLGSTKSPYYVMSISYTNELDCRKTEYAIRRYVTSFKPRNYSEYPEYTSIALSHSLKNRLKKLKRGSESYESVIWYLLLEYYDKI